MPKDGKAKGGTPETRVGNWLKSLNAKEGPEINFTGKCDRYPNTELYHVALQHVQATYGEVVQSRVSSRIFKGYYQDGIYPDEANIIALALEVEPAIDAAALQADLRDPKKAEEVCNYAQQLAGQLQVSGVPYFIINNVPSFSGAQEEAAFVKAFESAKAMSAEVS
jgi:predicted DsbA family dithiol-disulfide isomerase